MYKALKNKDFAVNNPSKLFNREKRLENLRKKRTILDLVSNMTHLQNKFLLYILEL